jgi:hypothetical protein
LVIFLLFLIFVTIPGICNLYSLAIERQEQHLVITALQLQNHGILSGVDSEPVFLGFAGK